MVQNYENLKKIQFQNAQYLAEVYKLYIVKSPRIGSNNWFQKEFLSQKNLKSSI